MSTDDESSLGDSLVTILEHRILIAVVAFAAVALAALYLFVAAPIYRSDVLLQVEDKTKGLAGLDEMSDVFSEKSAADTEIEIIRSRWLIGTVVDQLSLTIEARPRTFPVFGGAFYRRHDGAELATAPAGLTGFAWGGERIRVTRLQVPERYLDQPLLLTAQNDRFALQGPKGEALVSGEVGKPASAGEGDEHLEIFVQELRAQPGTQFRVTSRRRAAVIDDLQTEMRVSEKGKKTGVLTVALDGNDPKKIASILDAIGQTYLKQNIERKSAEAAKTFEFVQGQLPSIRKNVDAAEASMKTYQVERKSVDLTAETQALLDRAVEIDKALSELSLSRAEMRQRFTDTHPVLLSIKEKEDKLRVERSALEARMRGLPQQAQDTVRLNRDAKVASDLYFLLLNKSQELLVVKSGTLGNVRILDTALNPYEPVSPKKLPVLALSLFFGLAAGIAAAFVRKALDQGVEDPAEIEAGTGLTVYASVPHSEREGELTLERTRTNATPSVLAAIDPNDLAVESLRSLRTALQFALVDAPNNIVTICGPSPEVGKSFLAINLGHVLALSGKRVLLIDADLRRGHLHRYLGQKRGTGVSEVVAGQSSLSDTVRKTTLETLDLLATGALPPNPAEVVGGARFQALLTEASKGYDLVLVDTPPILAVTDAALIGRRAGVNILAIRSGKHPMRELTLAVKRFHDSGVRINGAVVNAVSEKFGRYSRYAYHYQYEYRSDTKD